MSELPDGGRYIDWYGVDWTWVASAGGPMVTPGTQLLDDITKWETDMKFPDLKSFDWTDQAKNFMENTYNSDKVMNVNIGAGCTERLVAVLGGYSESMLAMAMEPEAVIDFCNYFADFTIRFLDIIFGFFPVNMVTMHDDWGTERDTFFSSAMMEEMILEPTNRIVQHVKNKGSLFELHSCGNIMRFIPYMIDMNIDFMQIQRRAVDIPAAKAKYGDRIGFDTGIEASSTESPYRPQEMNLYRRSATPSICMARAAVSSRIFSRLRIRKTPGTPILNCTVTAVSSTTGNAANKRATAHKYLRRRP
jgi:hypothetical protein